MMRSRCRAWVRRFSIVIGVLCPVAFAGSETIAATPEQVDAALAKAIAYIYRQQSHGLWETVATPPSKAEAAAAPTSATTGGQWGGETALATYALLAAGESPLDPKLAPAIKFLETAPIKGTYALGLRAQIYPFLPPSKQLRLEAAGDVARFKDAMNAKGAAKGLFDYLLDSPRAARVDHSVSQYGVLGAWACERSGAEVESPFWQAVEDAWIRDQAKDGSWCYQQEASETYPETASMTVAGVATLFITQDYLHASNGIKCTGNVVNPHIEAGLAWIGKNFDHVFTDKSLLAPYYGLYGVERVGVASGRKYLGGVNWYERGADFLVKNQAPDGSWGGAVRGPATSTSLAVLFLTRGRAPVIFNKLQYDVAGKEGNWNQRPRDIANLVRWIGKKTERDLNWQIVNLKGSVGELLDAPVLYLSGNRSLAFKPDEENKLREFCQAGGLILGNPDCTNKNFSDSFRKLGAKLFPDYEFRELPADHPIFNLEQYPRSTWKSPPSILSLSNGVRELMMIAPETDMARQWQLEETGKFEPEFQLPDDILLYAIDKKNLNEKGKTFYVTPDPAIATTREIKLARLQYAGNWDPEPGGWRRMAAIFQNKLHIKLDVSAIKLGAGKLGDGKSGVTIATLTGTNALKLDTAQRQEIKNFVLGGGTLIADAAGGSTDFAASAESELQSILGPDLGKQLSEPLPPSAAVYNLPGNVIKEFTFRGYARANVGATRAPRVTAVLIDKRPAVYFSRLDLSAGLVGVPTDGIIGYDPFVATAIMENLVMSAAK